MEVITLSATDISARYATMVREAWVVTNVTVYLLQVNGTLYSVVAQTEYNDVAAQTRVSFDAVRVSVSQRDGVAFVDVEDTNVIEAWLNNR